MDADDLFADPMKKFREQQERMEHLMDPMKKFREQQERMEHLMDPMKKFREQQERLASFITDPMKDLLTSPQFFRDTLSPITVDTIREDRRRWLELSQSLAFPTDIVEEGEVLSDSEDVNAEQLSRDIQDISSNSVSLHDFNNKLIAWIESLPEVAKFIAFYLVLPYILSVLAGAHTPLWVDAWKDYSHLPERIAKKEIIKDVTEIFSINELREHRFTTASKLRVRQHGSTKSEILDSLPFGTVVRVIDKAKDWTFVEYSDNKSQSTKEGWVFSRYLEKFKK